MKNKTLILPLFFIFFVSVFCVLQDAIANPEARDAQTNNNRDLDMDMSRGVDRAGSRGTSGVGASKFGDNVGVGFAIPDPEERRNSAIFGQMFTDKTGKVTDEDVQRAEGDINKLYADKDKTEAQIEKVYSDQEERAIQAYRDQQARLAQLDRETLERNRKAAWESVENYGKMAASDGRWTPEELDAYERRYSEYLKFADLTPEEQLELERQQKVRDQVYDEISRSADQMGGTSDAEVQERLDRAKQFDAATQTWRNVTFTGKMANEVGMDIANQRERGIAAKNKVIAAQNYINRTDITDEQRAIAQSILTFNQGEMGAAADAISKDSALILLGTATDVAMLGIGKGVSYGVGKAGTAVRGWIAGGSEAGAAAGTTAGTEAGTALSNAGKAAAPEAGAGSQGAARVAAEEIGEAGGKTQQMSSGAQQAANQAYNDAKAAEALGQNRAAPINMESGVGNTVQVPQSAGGMASGVPATGSLAKNLSQAEIDELFKPGANLTPTQIMQKLDLIRSGQAPTRTLDPETYRALDQAMIKNFPEIALQRLTNFLSGAADEAAGAAAGGAKSGAPVLTPPPGFNPGISSGGTIVGQEAGQAGGSAAAGAAGKTGAFEGALTLPHAGPGATAAAGEAAAGGTQVFKQTIPTPKLGAPTPAQVQAAENAHKTLETIAKEKL